MLRGVPVLSVTVGNRKMATGVVMDAPCWALLAMFKTLWASLNMDANFRATSPLSVNMTPWMQKNSKTGAVLARNPQATRKWVAGKATVTVGLGTAVVGRGLLA